MMLSTERTTCLTPPTPSPIDASLISWGLSSRVIDTESPGRRKPLNQTGVGRTVVSPKACRNLRKSIAALGCIR